MLKTRSKPRVLSPNKNWNDSRRRHLDAISVVILLRTDTTLDLSQKAEKVCTGRLANATVNTWRVKGVRAIEPRITQPDARSASFSRKVINAAAVAIAGRAHLPSERARRLIIVILRVCRVCRLRNKENTIEVILFEYSRQENDDSA